MPNGKLNPLTAPLTMIKQIGEQTSTAIQSMGTGMTNIASQGLDALILGVPGLPGVPGAAARPGFPTLQSLLPANLQQALGQVENLLIPAGLPRPSQALKAAPKPQPQPTPTSTAGAETPPAVAMRRRVAERRGM